MKTKHTIMFAAIAIAAALVAMPGCEEDKSIDGLDKWFDNNPMVNDPRASTANKSLTLSPLSVSVDVVGERVAFEVSGGRPPYTWQAVNISRGIITPAAFETDSAVYTTYIVADNNVIVYDKYGKAGIADILGTPPTFQILSDSTLSILNAAPTNSVPYGVVGANETTTLRAVGGATPYGAWVSGNTSIGYTTNVSGTTVTFVYKPGTNAGGNTIVSLVDADGKVTTATMTILITTVP